MIVEPAVSIIITTRNEEANIASCLASITNQTYPGSKIEILVVDNNSDDRTKEIAGQFTEKAFNYGPERSSQRNFGIRQASGKYILYLDADMVLSKDIVSKCVSKCESENIVALYIPERITGRGFWIKVRDFERSFYDGTAIDCVRFVGRDKILEIGGFDEGLTGPEDWDFDRRIRALGKVGIIDSPIYHNEGWFTYARYLEKKLYYAKSFDKYIQKWGNEDPLIKKQLGFWYRFFGVFIENGKWQRLLAHPLLSAGLYILRFSVGVRYALGRKKGFLTRKGILIISPFFRPNIGGVETHLDDLCGYLRRTGLRVYVITYQPLTTRARAPSLEMADNLEIRRIWWFGLNLFHTLEGFPVLEFLYLTPRLFISTFLFVLCNRKKLDVIHAHGFNSAFIARVLKFIFKIRVVVSTHAVYNLPEKGIFTRFLRWALNGSDKVLCISRPSMAELSKIGIRKEILGRYTYWVDQEVFKPSDSGLAKERLGWQGKFVVLFVGRFIQKKGIAVLIEAAYRMDKNIYFAFVGDGPMEEKMRRASAGRSNIILAGKIDNKNLVDYYNAAALLCVPSLYDEAFGRVIIEALSCGLPAVASNRGAIPDVLSDEVGILVRPTPEDIAGVLSDLYKNPERLKVLSYNCRQFAAMRFSVKNGDDILHSYF